MISFYIGTYTSGLSRGIYRAVLNTQTASIENVQLAAEVDNPTFLTLHPTLPVLYSCREVRRDGKREGSQVVAFKMDASGQLTAIGAQPSGGSGPCYVSVDRYGKVVLVANYGSGSLGSISLADDGSLLSLVTTIQHSGHSINPDRQAGPHAHCTLPDPSNHYACAVDLGLDQVIIYQLDISRGSLNPQPASQFHAEPGQGPRHIAFHPSGQQAFIINEMGNNITTASWCASTGELNRLSSIDTLPPDFTAENTTAEILVHPNGRWVYGSNRGHDSLAVYAFDIQAGCLTLIEHVASGGKTPRNFRIDPTGQYLLVANQDSDSIVVFQIDQSSGRLTQTAPPVTVGNPCCIKFVSNT